ncbi:hypothetical protein BpHYR1_051314 [Brachionus plicatilis]|uniref:Uncharacterized protein n=1 Tax=Brachionus plicatilis TaxID=10195 RepID=A0A3M7SSH7_BRAPC|nr:hypothetical protein BpHYR1_051314 [Brachionus plicatilis]
MDNHICLIGGQIFYFIVHVFFQLSTCISNCPDIYDCPWTIVREGYKTRLIHYFIDLLKYQL